MAARSRRKSRKSKSGSPAIGWFATGLIIGLGGAVFLYSQGFMPSVADKPEAREPGRGDAGTELLPDGGGKGTESPPRYDFFTVLPEMEVVVPEKELSTRAQPQQPRPSGDSSEEFILQVGSFRSPSDADQMKARLALLGSVASIQKVTVNNETWHRVRIGPVSGAQQANQLRRQLQDNGVDVLVLKGSR